MYTFTADAMKFAARYFSLLSDDEQDAVIRAAKTRTKTKAITAHVLVCAAVSLGMEERLPVKALAA